MLVTTTTLTQPSPWELEYLPYTSQSGNEIPHFRINDADGNAVCETNEDLLRSIQEPSAWLIAAAPELPTALEAYVDYFDDSYGERADDMRLAARDAMAKAKGAPL